MSSSNEKIYINPFLLSAACRTRFADGVCVCVAHVHRLQTVIKPTHTMRSRKISFCERKKGEKEEQKKMRAHLLGEAWTTTHAWWSTAFNVCHLSAYLTQYFVYTRSCADFIIWNILCIIAHISVWQKHGGHAAPAAPNDRMEDPKNDGKKAVHAFTNLRGNENGARQMRFG